MNAQQRKIVRDHAKNNGHLVSLWDSRDFSWYARHRMPQIKKRAANKTPNASYTDTRPSKPETQDDKS